MTPFERRLAALEAARRAKRPAPCVLRVPFGKTVEQARAAFEAEYKPKVSHCVLVVPSKPRTQAEQEVWENRFHAAQMTLVADAQHERTAVPIVAPVPRPLFNHSPTVRPKGRSLIQWKPNA